MTTKYHRCDLGPNPSLNTDVPRGASPAPRATGYLGSLGGSMGHLRARLFFLEDL